MHPYSVKDLKGKIIQSVENSSENVYF